MFDRVSISTTKPLCDLTTLSPHRRAPHGLLDDESKSNGNRWHKVGLLLCSWFYKPDGTTSYRAAHSLSRRTTMTLAFKVGAHSRGVAKCASIV